MPPSTPATSDLPLENTYAGLSPGFHARVDPTPVASPRLLRLNEPLAEHLGLPVDFLRSDEGVALLSGNRVPEGVTPIAMAYAGHQFGNWVPQLGDGRALLLGEVIDRDGVRRDVQLKGSGPTPFSRNGDGRAALGPVLREYAVSEAMAALGIPTTRALAMVETGEPVFRERALPGAVLCRVARGHVRVGTFQYFLGRGEPDALRELADYVIARRYPELVEAANPYRALLEAVMDVQADLIARWMGVGFIHGVMNTDNMSVLGETIDYGPCAFIDTYHPSTVFSSIDHGGRYAYDQQPNIGLWNLTRFAETLLHLFSDDEEQAVEQAKESLAGWFPRFQERHHALLRAKIGLLDEREDDLDLAASLLAAMRDQQADFTLTFRGLCELDFADAARDESVRALFADPSAFDAWATQWRARLAGEGRDDERRARMRAINPAFIPRNHRVQQAIEAAEEGDLAPFDRLLAVTTQPYDDHPEHADLTRPPEPDEVVHQTFCGT